MQGIQKYKSEQLLKEQKKAVTYYKTGLSLRKVAHIMNRSHQWVKVAVDKLDVPLK